MNRQRRDTLDGIITLLSDQKMDLEECKNEEEQAYENLPESLQSSEKGEKMQEATQNLEDAISSLDDAINSITSSME
jgi:sugar-specific transcriptional regulator TrmB